MTTTSASSRASRRAAATAAASRQAASTTPETLASIMNADVDEITEAEVDEAFGPEPVSAAPETAAKASPVSPPQTGVSVPVRAAGGLSGAIAVPMEDLSRKIDVGDMVIPKLRISQAMSKTNTLFSTSRGSDGVGMGSWYNSATNQNFGETVYFVPVDMRKTRAYFVQGMGLQCRSFDMVQGQGDPGLMCEGTPEERLTVPAEKRGCPLRHWEQVEGGRSIPPKCGVTYNFPGFVVDLGEDGDIDDPGRDVKLIQVMLQLRSTATKAARQMITFVMNEGGRVWQNCLFELTVEGQTNSKGTFFVPVADLYDTTDQPVYARIRRRANSMARAMGAVDTAEFEDGDSD